MTTRLNWGGVQFDWGKKTIGCKGRLRCLFIYDMDQTLKSFG